MTEERKKILDKINGQIAKLTSELLSKFPAIHDIDDGFVVHYFTDWDACDENTKIRYKRIVNVTKPEETVVFFFIPKGAHIEHKKRDYIGCITCLTGELELNVNNEIVCLEGATKMCLDTDEFHGRALKNTYLITTNTV
jgi:hypothetical protein